MEIFAAPFICLQTLQAVALSFPKQCLSHHGSPLQYERRIFNAPSGWKVIICGSELKYSRSLSLCFCMNTGPTVQLVKGCPLLHADFDASCEPKSALGLFIKLYCSGKDYKSDDHSLLASTWFVLPLSLFASP